MNKEVASIYITAAIQENDVSMLKVFMGPYDNEKLSTPRGGSLFHLALRNNKLVDKRDLVRQLLTNQFVDPNTNYGFVLWWACRNGYGDVVERLLNDNNLVILKEYYDKSIQWASMNGHLDVVTALLKTRKGDPSAENNLALRLARRKGHNNVVEELIKSGENVKRNAKDPQANQWQIQQIQDPQDAFLWAAENGNMESMVQLLMDTRVDPTAHENLAIRIA